MNIISCQPINLTNYGYAAHRHAYAIHVKITNVAAEAAHIISILSNTSWIHTLDVIDADAYLERATPTIQELVNNILNQVGTAISNELGEYLVSSSAKEVLCTSLHHSDIPLAELWKEKLTGNPGFDFHTESPAEILVFGEAKYSSLINPHPAALEQITRFIALNKDVRFTKICFGKLCAKSS
ncbi:hypothetical protein [Alistipes sp.]|jgi:hypothetical protein|uniref:hypothetical protein n=1 Tax=Alistipes sp. TaxID=1872444 RepID=UPI0011CA2123